MLPTVLMHPDEQTTRSRPATPPTCRIIQSTQTDQWYAAMDQLNEYSRFLCEKWTKLLEKTYHYETFLISLEERGSIVAALPICSVRSPITGFRGVSLPFFDYCRSFHTQQSHLPRLYNEIVEFGKTKGWDYLELRGDLNDLPNVEASLEFFNHVVDLSAGPEKAFANLASSTRRAIRKAMKSGVEIEFSDSEEALAKFYRQQCLTRKRHGLPPQPYRFFLNFHQSFIETGQGTIISAQVDGVPTASAIYITQGDTVHYKYGASSGLEQQSRCNNLVMWKAIEFYSNLGYQSLDLGRNPTENEGLRKYKLGWGSSEKVTAYHRLDLKQNKAIPMKDDVYGWYNKLFSSLPSPILRMAGRMLYKHIA